MAEESPLRYLNLYCRELSDPLVLVHLHLPATDGEHVEAAHFWKPALHGSTSHGRNVDLGDLRKPPYRSSHPSNTLRYRPANDERTSPIETRCSDCFHVQSCVSFVLS